METASRVTLKVIELGNPSIVKKESVLIIVGVETSIDARQDVASLPHIVDDINATAAPRHECDSVRAIRIFGPGW